MSLHYICPICGINHKNSMWMSEHIFDVHVELKEIESDHT